MPQLSFESNLYLTCGEYQMIIIYNKGKVFQICQMGDTDGTSHLLFVSIKI